MGIEILLITLGFITFWVLAALFMRARYSHRPGLGSPGAGRTTGQRGCCLLAPCGPECEKELQALRDRAGSQHDQVIAAIDQMMFDAAAPEESRA